ncbi:MAG TPA: polyhydroxyalkanoic acid system family protein [Polyangiaceae bacterium]|nr:polyhydroxyalkanoic acid system family protein [Polyangiaceae bacterium]
MKHSVPHSLGQEKAKQVALAAIRSYSERFAKYTPTAQWLDEQRAAISFKVKGMTLSGKLQVNPNDIEMDLDVPFMLRPFKGTALGVIEEEMKKWIAKATAGEI